MDPRARRVDVTYLRRFMTWTVAVVKALIRINGVSQHFVDIVERAHGHIKMLVVASTILNP